jgi:hypothetical protein
MSDTLKIIPSATANNLLPPNLNHTYFANADSEKHCFRPNDNAFSLVNAWWLAESSLLAYADAAFAKKNFQAAGLQVEFFSGESTGTQCYVAYTNEFAIVAFRGTQVIKNDASIFHDVLKDILTDVNFLLVDSKQGGNVHQGFKTALDEIWDDLLACLKQLHLQNPKQTFWFTGHSLGAALATLAADRYGHAQGLYTFGSPCVGDNAFADDFYVNTYRFVHNNDIVAHVPLLPYVHVGQLKYIDSHGNLHDNLTLLDRLADNANGWLKTIINSIGSLRAGWEIAIPFDNLIDHAPLFYALHVWNCYIKSIGSAK